MDNPKTFNEKIQHFKLYQTDQIYVNLTDKYKVREYVKSKIPEDILIPLLWHGTNPQDIPFESLPNSFVLKCNHGSGYNIIVHDKEMLDIEATKIKLQTWLSEDFGGFGRERHYRMIKEKLVLVEELLPPEEGPLPVDFKMHCFNGRLEFIGLSLGRGTPEGVTGKCVSRDWGPLDFGIVCHLHPTGIKKPANLEKLIKYSEFLAKGFPFVRVDLYNVAEKIYFGEMTFTAYSGYIHFFPDHHEVDRRLGALIPMNNH